MIELNYFLQGTLSTVSLVHYYDDCSVPFTSSMQIIGENLEQYDDEHHPAIGANITDIEMVKYLMESHHLHQKDLADILEAKLSISTES